MMRFCVLLLALIACASQAQDFGRGAGGSISLASGEGRILHFVAPVDSVLVAEPNVADLQVVSPGTIYIFGKAPGNTSLIALGNDGKQLASLTLSVSSDSQAVTTPMQTLHPGNGAQISGAGNRLIAKGTLGSVAEATDLNALLNPQGQGFQSAINTTEYAGAAQVNLRVRFAEVSRSELLHYGVNWNAMFNNGTFSFGLITGGPLAAATAGGLATAGTGSGNVNIDGMLDALQANGILQILAEPNITAMTGQTASFLAGGEVAIPVPVNRDLVGIEYKSFGVSLLFNPTLLPNGRIALQVRPEVSSVVSGGTVDFGNFHVPSFSVRRADTRVEVGSGQTFAIAGLFQRESSQDIEKLPLLGDLPILGNLFRSKRFQRNETELVILITPYLVEPVRGRGLATPLDALPTTAAASGPRSDGAFGFYMN